LERALARRFPRGDVAQRIVPLGAGGAGTGPGAGDRGERGRLEALSASRFRVEFMASEELYEKIERARELLSHSLPSGDLAAVFERALDALIAGEVRRRMGAGLPRKRQHRVPHALGGASTVENVCLLCAGHNRYTAREVFGPAYVEQKRAERVKRTDARETGMGPQSCSPDGEGESSPGGKLTFS
jgi:hypothetical protein